MKKIVFLIIGTLLVLGLVLPGCGGNGAEEDFDQYITIGIAGPMGQSQGQHHMYGAELARDEINNDGAGGVTVGSLVYGIKLVEIDTNEVLSPSGADGLTAMSAQIGNVDLVMGGFRTEAVFAYRTIAVGPTGADKIFIDCGAATEALTHSVVDDYDNYKYWFKGTPPNELFLSTANSKMIGMIVAMTTGYKKIVTANVTAEYAPKIAFIAEDALWTVLSRILTTLKLGADYGWLVGPTPTYVWTPGPVATVGAMNVMLTDIATYDPEIILTIMSGPVGVTYANLVGDFMPDVLTLGINVEAQRVGFPDVADFAEGMIFLDSWAPGVNLTAKTADFLDAFETETGQWPIYTAATYDALLSLVESIDTADSLSAAALIPVMEASVYTGTSGTTGYYPLDDGSTTGTHPFGPGLGYPDTTAALNEDQVLDLYPWLPQAKFAPYPPTTVYNWTWDADDWTMLPHTSHDLVFGTEWVTALASQWQDVEGTLTKVGVWPKPYLAGDPYFLPTSQAVWLGYLAGTPDPVAVYTAQKLGLWDQYGYWHFEYPGTGTVKLTDWWTWLATGW